MRGSQQGLVGRAGARLQRALPRVLSRLWPGTLPITALLSGLAMTAGVVWFLRRNHWAAALGELLCLSLMMMVWLLVKGQQQARALDFERRRLDSIIEGTGAGTWEWNCVTGETVVNERYAEMLGYRRSEIPVEKANFWHSLVEPQELIRTGEQLQRHLQGLAPIYECEVRMRHRAGHWVWVLVRGKICSCGADGRPVWVAGANLDVSERHALDDELRTSEVMLNHAGRLAGVGGWELLLPTKELRWSLQACLMQDRPAGFKPTLKDALSHYPPESLPRVQALLGRLAQGHAVDAFEVPLITATGRRIQVRIVGEPMPPEVPGGPVQRVVGSIQDVTEKHRLEDAMRCNNEVLRQVIEHLPCGLCVYDGNNRLVMHNTQFRRLLRLPASFFDRPQIGIEDVVDFNFGRGEYGEGEAAQVMRSFYLQYAANPTDLVLERQMIDGTTQELHGAPLPGGGFVVTYTDLSERRRGERLLRNAMDSIDEGFVLFDPEDRLVHCNNRYRELYADVAELLRPGVSYEQILRGRIAADPSHEAHGRQEAWIAERLAQHRLGESRFVHRTHDGRWVRMLERKLPDGHIAGFRIDITDLMQATEAAEKASLAKSQFLANMSHEIRTPMNAVLGMLKLLQRTELSPRQQDYAVKTEGAARSLLDLLNDILDFSKVEAGKMSLDLQPMRIDELLRDLSVILAANVGQRDVEVLFDVDAKLPRCVIADAMRLRQVLINLASNAIKFTEIGEVVIRLKLVAREADAVTLDFSVADTGIGIAPEHQLQIFDGFMQAEASTTRRYGGTGLGLAISRRLARLMGTELQLESVLGRGSRFYFRLRLGLPEQQPELQERTPQVPIRALVVDDHANARELLAAMCESLGWQVDMAESGNVALDRIRAMIAAGDDYQVVLIDWAMPGLDGWETSRGVRTLTRRRSPPVVVMVSAHGREMLSQRSHREQGLLDAFLVKPVTASMLYDAVSDARAVGPQTDFGLMLGALNGGALPDAAGQRLRFDSSLLAGRFATPAQSQNRLAGLRLLVVEDNLNNRQVARELLEDEGAKVVLADDGQQALSQLALARQEGRIDAVLMDVQMPVMDGFTATRLIRRQLRLTLPIIAMTANARASDRQACLDAGMTEHVGKPFDIDHLVGVLLRHCGGATSAAGTAAVRSTPASLPPALLERARASGIELGEALARMSGKSELFVRTVSALADAAKALPAPPTPMSLHGLRGLAATLGAVALAELMAIGERALEAGAGLPVGWPARFETELASHLVVLAELAGQLPAEAARNGPALTDAADALVADLAQLVALLDGSDMAALDVFTSVRERLHACQPEAQERLDEALATLDFASAAGQCRALLRGLPA